MARIDHEIGVGLYLLGCREAITAGVLTQEQPPLVNGKTPLSFIGPVLERVTKEHPWSTVVVIGNGTVFDLDDWLEDPSLEGWLFVRSGQDSLHGERQIIQEISASDATQMPNLLDYLRSFKRPANTESQRILQHNYQWTIDKTGYPLLWVDPLNSYIHLFPITKPQFERYLVATMLPDYTDQWYAEVLSHNPRVSFRCIDQNAYERLFITGITVGEATAFGTWLDGSARLLTVEEWRTCFQWLANQPATSAPADLRAKLTRDARAIWKIVETQCAPTTLLELSLFSGGVMEWVWDASKQPVGLGDPHLNTSFSRRLRQVFDIVKPIVARPRDFGSRFLITPFKRRT